MFLTPQDLTQLIKLFLHGPHRKHRSSVAVQLLLSDGMAYSIVSCAAIGADCAKNIIPLLLFTGRCIVTADSCDSIFVLREYATIF
jgi:hypothetical protein